MTKDRAETPQLTDALKSTDMFQLTDTLADRHTPADRNTAADVCGSCTNVQAVKCSTASVQ